MLLFFPRHVLELQFCVFTTMAFIFVFRDFTIFVTSDLNVHLRSFAQFAIVFLYLFLFILILINQLVDAKVPFKAFQIVISQLKDFLMLLSITVLTSSLLHSITVCSKTVNLNLHYFSHYETILKQLVE